MTHRYDDIINLPHHVSQKHAPMARADRAAQFSPFAALTGLDAALRETARLTDQRITLDEYEQAELDKTLQALREAAPQHPAVHLHLRTSFRGSRRRPKNPPDGSAGVTVTYCSAPERGIPRASPSE